jgi:hypothetical protein
MNVAARLVWMQSLSNPEAKIEILDKYIRGAPRLA